MNNLKAHIKSVSIAPAPADFQTAITFTVSEACAQAALNYITTKVNEAYNAWVSAGSFGGVCDGEVLSTGAWYSSGDVGYDVNCDPENDLYSVTTIVDNEFDALDEHLWIDLLPATSQFFKKLKFDNTTILLSVGEADVIALTFREYLSRMLFGEIRVYERIEEDGNVIVKCELLKSTEGV